MRKSRQFTLRSSNIRGECHQGRGHYCSSQIHHVYQTPNIPVHRPKYQKHHPNFQTLQKIFKTHGKIWKTVNIIQFYYFMFEFIILSKTLTKYLSLDFSFLVFLVLVFVKIDPVSGGCCEGMDGFWPLKFWYQNFGLVLFTPKV